MSDRQNLNWKMRFLVKVIVFGSSLYCFTVNYWLHHLVPLAKLMEECFLHLHFSICSVFDCPAFFFCSAPTAAQLQITVAQSLPKLRNKFWIQFVGRSPDELSQRHAPGLSLASVCVAKSNKPSTWSNALAFLIQHKDHQTAALWLVAAVHEIGPRVQPGQVNEIIRKYCSRAPWTSFWLSVALSVFRNSPVLMAVLLNKADLYRSKRSEHQLSHDWRGRQIGKGESASWYSM